MNNQKTAASTGIISVILVLILGQFIYRKNIVWMNLHIEPNGINISDSFEVWVMVHLIFLLLVPMIMIVYVFNQEPSSFGVAKGDYKFGIRATGILLLLVLPFLIFGSRQSSFLNSYPLWNFARNTNLYTLIYYELAMGVYFFVWEFFFRGFLLFGLQKGVGSIPAIILQAIPFGLLHAGKPPLEFLASFPVGIILGIVAVRSKSFFPCFAIHWVAAGIFDILIVMTKMHIF